MKFKDKQSVREYLNGSKIYVNGKSEEIQKVLFKYGFDRKDESIEDECVVVKEVGNTYNPFIYVTCYIFCTGCDMDHFHNHPYKELKAEDVLSIEVEKSQKKYEFKTFDKVLMCADNTWEPCFFRASQSITIGAYDEIHCTRYMSMGGLISAHCIPYEGNESLLGKPYNHEDEI